MDDNMAPKVTFRSYGAMEADERDDLLDIIRSLRQKHERLISLHARKRPNAKQIAEAEEDIERSQSKLVNLWNSILVRPPKSTPSRKNTKIDGTTLGEVRKLRNLLNARKKLNPIEFESRLAIVADCLPRPPIHSMDNKPWAALLDIDLLEEDINEEEDCARQVDKTRHYLNSMKVLDPEDVVQAMVTKNSGEAPVEEMEILQWEGYDEALEFENDPDKPTLAGPPKAVESSSSSNEASDSSEADSDEATEEGYLDPGDFDSEDSGSEESEGSDAEPQVDLPAEDTEESDIDLPSGGESDIELPDVEEIDVESDDHESDHDQVSGDATRMHEADRAEMDVDEGGSVEATSEGGGVLLVDGGDQMVSDHGNEDEMDFDEAREDAMDGDQVAPGVVGLGRGSMDQVRKEKMTSAEAGGSKATKSTALAAKTAVQGLTRNQKKKAGRKRRWEANRQEKARLAALTHTARV